MSEKVSKESQFGLAPLFRLGGGRGRDINGNINETIYMIQLENFVFGDPKSMVC